MKRQLLALAALPAAMTAAYTIYYTDAFPTLDGTKWPVNGNVAVSNGVYTADPNGGSLISTVNVPDGSSDYEVRSTLSLPACGGTFVQYLRASNDALSGPLERGTFYAAEMQFTGVPGACSGTLSLYQRQSGVTTLLSQVGGIAPTDGMVVRSVYVSYGAIMVFVGDYMALYRGLPAPVIAAGKPGVGVRATAGANRITLAQLGPADRAAPSPVGAQNVGTPVYPNYVDFQVAAPLDDGNGTGVIQFQVHRNGAYLLQTRYASFTDATVTPGQTYTYSIVAVDWHNNASAATVVTVAAPQPGSIDPRRVGVKPTGAYWGGLGEQIDMQSGNLHFSMPLVRAQGRTGWGVTFGLSYNSQMWRQDGGGIWKLGGDVGYGFGWRLMAGPVTPVLDTFWSVHHWVYTDASGAEYRLDVNNNGVWTSSRDGVYVWYDANAGRLYFQDGTFWTMGAVSSGAEADAGTRYPTAITDSNGNQVLVRYGMGAQSPWLNSSARISQIEDVRATLQGSIYYTYQFLYDTGATPNRLTGITNTIETAESYSFTYTAAGLTAPFAPYPGYGTAQLLTGATALGVNHTTSFFYATGAGELTRVQFPFGGSLEWDYRNFTYLGGRTLREVQTRRLIKSAGAPAQVYTIARDANDSGRTAHYWAALDDAGSLTQKAWVFYFDGSQWNVGLPHTYGEREQDVDGLGYGNVVAERVYDYNALGTPTRSYAYTYKSGAEGARHDFRRTGFHGPPPRAARK